MNKATVRNIAIVLATLLLAHTACAVNSSPELRLTPQNALEAHGLSIFFFHNSYHPVFGDQKMSGLEIIFHDRRIATNGDVRLSATPAQWDPIPQFKERKQLHRAFPDVVGAEYTFRGLDYVLGVHPVSDVSYVSGIGAQSKLIAYGNNRADYTFIPGGMIPGVTVVQPDFPELTNDWPFLWYENEYVVDTATAFILAANCANAIGNEAAEKP